MKAEPRLKQTRMKLIAVATILITPQLDVTDQESVRYCLIYAKAHPGKSSMSAAFARSSML
jgi:hypothetical protein